MGSQMPKNTEALAYAIRKACDEHGRPNSFSPGELRQYGAPSALLAGKIGRNYIVNLWRALGGRESWGSCPVYAPDTKRFYL